MSRQKTLRFTDLTRQPAEDEEWDDALGQPRPRCAYCEFPLQPGDVAIQLQQFEVLLSRKSQQDIYQDVHMEDGDPEKLFHLSCFAALVPLHVLGAETHNAVV
tara:strand:+ start:3144 stop:3452 length:309 start_codon:yes stop_codon:yes gene_type:complete